MSTKKYPNTVLRLIEAIDRGYCVYYPSSLFRNTRWFKKWGNMPCYFHHGRVLTVNRIIQANCSESLTALRLA